MIVCSCAVITDFDIENALIDILNRDNAPLPTPGVVWRYLSKKMNCCACAPLAVELIYEKMEMLERRGLICPCACQTARSRMVGFTGRLRGENRRSDLTSGATDLVELAEAT